MTLKEAFRDYWWLPVIIMIFVGAWIIFDLGMCNEMFQDCSQCKDVDDLLTERYYHYRERCFEQSKPPELTEPTELNIRFEYDETEMGLRDFENNTIDNSDIVVFNGEWVYLIKLDIHKELCDLVCINYPFDKIDVELRDQYGIMFYPEQAPAPLRTTSSFDCWSTESNYNIDYRLIVIEQTDKMDEIGSMRIVCQKSEWMERQRRFNECMSNLEGYNG